MTGTLWMQSCYFRPSWPPHPHLRPTKYLASNVDSTAFNTHARHYAWYPVFSAEFTDYLDVSTKVSCNFPKWTFMKIRSNFSHVTSYVQTSVTGTPRSCERTLRNDMLEFWLDSTAPRQGPEHGSRMHGNELPSATGGKEIPRPAVYRLSTTTILHRVGIATRHMPVYRHTDRQTGEQVTSHCMFSIVPLVSRDFSLCCVVMDLRKAGQCPQETKTYAHGINYNHANMKRIFIRKLHYTRAELSHNKFNLRPLWN